MKPRREQSGYLFPLGSTGPVAHVRALLRAGKLREATDLAKGIRSPLERGLAWKLIFAVPVPGGGFDVDDLPGEWDPPEHRT